MLGEKCESKDDNTKKTTTIKSAQRSFVLGTSILKIMTQFTEFYDEIRVSIGSDNGL